VASMPHEIGPFLKISCFIEVYPVHLP